MLRTLQPLLLLLHFLSLFLQPLQLFPRLLQPGKGFSDALRLFHLLFQLHKLPIHLLCLLPGRLLRLPVLFFQLSEPFHQQLIRITAAFSEFLPDLILRGKLAHILIHPVTVLHHFLI